MPKRDAHLQFQKWANEYGPIYSLMLGTRVLIVLSSDQAVKDLLDKRSAIYSARQDHYVGQQLCSGGMRFLMMVSPFSHPSNTMLNSSRNMVQHGATFAKCVMPCSTSMLQRHTSPTSFLRTNKCFTRCSCLQIVACRIFAAMPML